MLVRLNSQPDGLKSRITPFVLAIAVYCNSCVSHKRLKTQTFGNIVPGHCVCGKPIYIYIV